MYVVMYHYVRKIKDSKYPGIKGLELDYFKQQLDFFKNNGFEFATVQDIYENKIKDNSVLLTFDDGYMDHYENVFPLLHNNGIQGVFSMPGKIIRESKVLDVNKIHFILEKSDIQLVKNALFKKMDFYRGNEFDIPDNQTIYEKLAFPNRFDDKDTIFVKRTLQVELPERLRNIITEELFKEFVTDDEKLFVKELYLSIDHIKEMKKSGMIFGFHGYDHYWMNRLTKEELVEDINKGMEVFDGIIDSKDWICCYPYGSCSDEVITTIKEMGATMGLATKVAKYNPYEDSIFEIPRFDTNDFPPKSENYKKEC
ncbi:MAG: polysaccharide deacetylase family protein [Lachnospiraceae bacterium]|nr:polysaccharide deacetylase family protein [Lachnospiraceae bacterium]